MRIYGIYNLKEKEQCIRVGTLTEIIKFLDLTAREVGSAVKKNSIVRKQYRICYLFTE